MTGRTTLLGSAAVAVLAAPLLLVGLLLTITTTTMNPAAAPPAINVDALPPLARQLLPDLQDLLTRDCPQLPLAWALAIPQVESSWNPAAYNATGHAAGLYQLTQPAWTAAGGTPWPTTPPPPDAPVFQPEPHLQRAIPFLCANLHTVTTHLAATGKPASPLDALLVCHVAGCGRVLDSPTGIPAPGDAGCDDACAATVHSYIASVHAVLDHITQPAAPHVTGNLPNPTPYTGPSGAGCTEPDPSSHGCLTPATRHALDQTLGAFGPTGPEQTIRTVSCWDPHTWNPTSDHPRGRACDLFPTRAGTFPTGTDLTNGWHIATWLRAHATALHISYLMARPLLVTHHTRHPRKLGNPLRRRRHLQHPRPHRRSLRPHPRQRRQMRRIADSSQRAIPPWAQVCLQRVSWENRASQRSGIDTLGLSYTRPPRR